MHALSIFGVKVWAPNIEKIRRETLQDLARQTKVPTKVPTKMPTVVPTKTPTETPTKPLSD